MSYEPKCGDLCEWGEGREHRVTIVGAFRCDVTGRPETGGACIQVCVDAPDAKPNTFRVGDRVPANTKSLRPLRPDAVGQRVRNGDGLRGAVIDGTAITVQWDDGWCSTHRPDALVRIADKAEPTKVARECEDCGGPLPYGGCVATPLCDRCLDKPAPSPVPAWTPPLCGCPGHDPACLCSTGWVRAAEAEPSVKAHHDVRDHRNAAAIRKATGKTPPRVVEITYIAAGSGRTAYGNTEAEAIANWRESHG